jgi:hypothetical protein
LTLSIVSEHYRETAADNTGHVDADAKEPPFGTIRAAPRFLHKLRRPCPADYRKETTMAHTGMRWERSDRKFHGERRIAPVRARQGRTGYRILAVLVAALVLAFLVWIPVAIWGEKQADDIAPQNNGPAPAESAPPAR